MNHTSTMQAKSAEELTTHQSKSAAHDSTGLTHPLSVLDANGMRIANEALDAHLQDLDNQSLISLYKDMRKLRRFDEEAFALTRQGLLTLWAPLLGQEAAQIGSLRALDDKDWVFGTYREHAAPLFRGAVLGQWLKTWQAHEYGMWDPHEINVANFQIIIGAQTLHAVGSAMGAKYRGQSEISVAYFGDGATSQGDVSEALVFASTYQAPVIFICQNNGYAISEPVEVQAEYPLATRAHGFNIPTLRVDGNDVLAMLAATRIAAERARNGGGPTFIEAMTYRMGPHTTTDDPSKYRSKDEEAQWREKDPITRLEKYLESLSFESTTINLDQIRAEATAEADELAAKMRQAATSSKPNDAGKMFDHVYVQETARVAKQRSDHESLISSLAVGVNTDGKN